MDIVLEATTERRVALDAPPEEVAAYFQRNENLLAELIGRERVEKLDENLYRVATRGFTALGMTLTPAFVVEFHDGPTATRMVSHDCHLLSGSGGLELDAAFEGEALFCEAPGGCELICWVAAQATVGLPEFVRLAPSGLVQTVLQGVMQAALDGLSLRFVPLIRADFARWRQNASLTL